MAQISIMQDIMTFFNNVADLTSDYVDRIELEPIRLYGDTYLTGFKRTFSYNATIEVHIKQMRKIEMKTALAIPDGEGYYFMEPDAEIWLPFAMLSTPLLIEAFKQFTDKFDKINEFHVLDVQYKEKGRERHHALTILYQNKRNACKDAIRFRKEGEQCVTKFHVFTRDNSKAKAQSDFEILTAAVE